MESYLKHGIKNAVITAAYVGLVALLITSFERAGKEPDSALGPMLFLLLLVISAAVTSFTVLGQPAMWYVDGKKNDALKLLGTTLVTLAVIVVLLILIVFK